MIQTQPHHIIVFDAPYYRDIHGYWWVSNKGIWHGPFWHRIQATKKYNEVAVDKQDDR